MKNNVGKYRESSGLTMAGLAAKAGVNTSTISRIENGLTIPDYPTMCRLAFSLETTIEELFSVEEYQTYKWRG